MSSIRPPEGKERERGERGGGENTDARFTSLFYTYCVHEYHGHHATLLSIPTSKWPCT